ncbi:SUKH-3 domain-containing protein [Kitasatospora sp. McL0602]|uniref:SUKH-3 domain-containing protein n=1 Tax=Kitasatospora sp. McL0602 TaxID=3439530 RepID=UPI003F8BD75F
MSETHLTEGLREALTSAGWSPENRPAAQDTDLRLLMAVVAANVQDGLLEPFPAARRILDQYGGLAIPPVGPGVEVASNGCVIDTAVARSGRTALVALAELLDSPVFPVGRVGSDVLAIDDRGQLFRQGQSGWWYLGATAEDGLARLVEGFAPARVDADGQWTEPAPLPREIHRGTWIDTGPASELLAAAMAVAAEATRPLRRHGLPALGRLYLTVEGESGGLPLLYQEFELDNDPEARIAEIVDRTFLRPGAQPSRVTVRLGPAPEVNHGWDGLVIARTDRSRELALRHRTPAGQQSPDPTAATATVAALTALIATHTAPQKEPA